MCQVQRVTNSCGHRNDHVLLVCHIAKPQSPPPVVNQRGSGQGPKPSNSVPIYSGLDGQLHLLARPISDSKLNPSADVLKSDGKEKTAGKNGTVNSGFHACTQPYCIYASIRELESPRGFKCMVNGCGRAD